MTSRELRAIRPQIKVYATRQLQDDFYAACRLKDRSTHSEVLIRFMKAYINDNRRLLDAAREQFREGYDAG
jgi:hypothetical protein